MKGLVDSSSDDEDFKGDDSEEEEDYDMINDFESLKNETSNEKTFAQKIPAKNEISVSINNTIYDLADASDSDSEDFKENCSESDSPVNDININSEKKIENKIENSVSKIKLLEESANITDIYLSKEALSESDSDDADFGVGSKANLNLNSESEAEYSDIENLKMRIHSSQKNKSNNTDELKKLFNTIITLISPYKTASEALSNSINDDQKSQKITDTATQLLFLGKYNIYSCDIEKLKEELIILQNV